MGTIEVTNGALLAGAVDCTDVTGSDVICDVVDTALVLGIVTGGRDVVDDGVVAAVVVGIADVVSGADSW